MVALAGALAFGLGGREVAGRILEDWYSRRGEMAAQAKRMGDAARHQGQPEGQAQGQQGEFRDMTPEEAADRVQRRAA
ncbi:MAG: mechanosensitive ion channel family protein, partial [Chloroflexota bacterium]